MSHPVLFTGIDVAELRNHLDSGVDPGGNPIEPFVDPDGGWSLRCCLTDSEPGDRIAIVAWSPFPWDGPYRETGPIVVHADGCEGIDPLVRLPATMDARPMQLRPYAGNRRIAYDDMMYVSEGDSVTAAVTALLANDDIDFVHGRNIVGGCFAFTARRS